MSSVAKAIQRLLNANTQEDIETILMQEPSLLTPEADELLAKHEEEARRAHDKDSAEMLAEIRSFLRDLRLSSTYELPDMPGSLVAFELIHALLTAAPKAAIPRAALDGVFSATLDSMRRHAQANNLAPMLDNLAALDKRLSAAGPPSWSAEGRPADSAADMAKPSILATIAAWVETESWLESHTLIVEHPELQTDEALSIVSLLARGAREEGDKEGAALYEQHASILKQARKGKLEDAYMDLLLSERAERARRGT